MLKRMLAMSMAVLVTWIWSSSYFLNVYAFEQGLGPFTLSGLRFLIGSAVLAVILVPSYRRRRAKGNKDANRPKKRPPLYVWLLLGLSGYAAAQGLQYAGQRLLEPTQVSLILSMANTLMVLAVDRLGAGESRDGVTVPGALVMIAGVVLFYFPWHFGGGSAWGISLVLLSSAGYALHLTLNRRMLANAWSDPLLLTLVPMAIGGAVLLSCGLAFEEAPRFGGALVGVVLCLGIVNGAAAFLLWTWSQQFLSAGDSGLINNLMLPEIALLEMVLFDRRFEAWQWGGITLVLAAVIVVQARRQLRVRRQADVRSP
ncbi:DMT family transporter [Saccharibacillus alkalitolerans]|uniref:DMT family transporter n=1 Tax=Saccharibacillus alkalitolerans TaxID=2705290 RepID=A0ABX0F8Y1_9BACL|nr:DMT family transporter [Saccharibacillus alkalitolerans]NGZ75944.1 DMT family transporter [Saccharibacillus alkalitolerans]